jgi:hypothetical protein
MIHEHLRILLSVLWCREAFANRYLSRVIYNEDAGHWLAEGFGVFIVLRRIEDWPEPRVAGMSTWNML